MPKTLEGTIALITGGSREIDAVMSKRVAADGANVAITYTKGADAAASGVAGQVNVATDIAPQSTH